MFKRYLCSISMLLDLYKGLILITGLLLAVDSCTMFIVLYFAWGMGGQAV